MRLLLTEKHLMVLKNHHHQQKPQIHLRRANEIAHTGSPDAYCTEAVSYGVLLEGLSFPESNQSNGFYLYSYYY